MHLHAIRVLHLNMQEQSLPNLAELSLSHMSRKFLKCMPKSKRVQLLRIYWQKLYWVQSMSISLQLYYLAEMYESTNGWVETAQRILKLRSLSVLSVKVS